MTRELRYGLMLWGLVIACVAGVVWLTRPHPTPEQAVAHERTRVATVAAAAAETVYVEGKLDAATRRVLYRAVRDSALRDLRDTLLVKRALAHADTAFVHDTIALVRADTVIVREKAAIAAKDTELVLAKYSPRLTTTVAALYDPLRGTFSGAGAISLRVLGPVSLVARVEQRPVLEKPSVRLGVAFSF